MRIHRPYRMLLLVLLELAGVTLGAYAQHGAAKREGACRYASRPSTMAVRASRADSLARIPQFDRRLLAMKYYLNRSDSVVEAKRAWNAENISALGLSDGARVAVRCAVSSGFL